MKLNPLSTRVSLAVAVGLSLSAASGRAQNVLVNSTISDAAAGGGVFDYTMTVKNTGTEAIESLWVGWIPGVFDISSPSNPQNSLGWGNSISAGASLQYAGTASTALLTGQTGTFTFASTSTPAQFMSHAAGDSTAYGVNAANGQLSFSLSGPDTLTFNPTVAVAAPEPSTFGLLAVGSLGMVGALRRKLLGR
jgi:hypothetical protein